MPGILPLLLPLAFGAAAFQAPVVRPVVSIGCGDCGGAAQFTAVADVAVSPNGTVWVADREDPQVRIFSPDGRHVRGFGRRGRGPGEYSGIAKMFVGGDGTAAIVDMGSFQLTRVDSTGRLLSTTPLHAFPLDAGAAPGSLAIHLLFSRFQPGTSLVRLAAPGSDSLRPVAIHLGTFPRPQAPAEIHSLAIGPDGSVAVGDGGTEYRIRVYRRSGTHDIVRDIPLSRRTPREQAALLAGMRGAAQLGRMEGGTAHPAPPPLEKPHFDWRGLRYDPRGRLWVKTGRGTDTRTILDVFAPSGDFLGEVPVPGKVTGFAFGGNYLVTAAEDAQGTPRVTLWRVK